METSSEATLFSALAFAADKHRNQRRKDPEASPYINHPIALARILAAEGDITNTVTLVAAVLHDTIEDTKTTADELRGLFGDRVTDVVLEVTDDKLLAKVERKKRQIEQAPFLTPQAKLVKLADKIANLRDVAKRSPADWSLDRRREYFDWAKKVIDGLRGVHPQLEAVFDAAYQARP